MRGLCYCSAPAANAASPHRLTAAQITTYTRWSQWPRFREAALRQRRNPPSSALLLPPVASPLTQPGRLSVQCATMLANARTTPQFRSDILNLIEGEPDSLKTDKAKLVIAVPPAEGFSGIPRAVLCVYRRKPGERIIPGSGELALSES